MLLHFLTLLRMIKKSTLAPLFFDRDINMARVVILGREAAVGTLYRPGNPHPGLLHYHTQIRCKAPNLGVKSPVGATEIESWE